MKLLPKFIYYIIILFGAVLLEFIFDLNVYTLLLICVVSLYFVHDMIDRQVESQNRIENRELQEEIKSTAKDAHLKNKQLLTVVSSIPFPILLLDQYGNIVMRNSNLEEIMTMEPEYEKMTYMDNNFAHPVREFIKDAFILEKKLERIIKIDEVEYQAISVPVLAKKRYSGCLVLFQDISKTLEGEKMQKRFIADASHELKTPISVIKGMVEILNRDDFDDDETEKEFLKQMEIETNRLDTLVKDLLQLSRLSMSNVILKREKCNICEIFDKAAISLEKSAQEKNLTIYKDYQSNDTVFCDPKKMEQVIVNLLSNAIKYSDAGTITLCTKTEGSMFIIQVSDEGCGIREKDLKRIYERFYRVNDDRSRKNGGSGLGLSIVKSIVDAHNGTIEVDSTFGKGTTFTVKLKN